MGHRKPNQPKPDKKSVPSKPEKIKPLQCPPHHMVKVGGHTWSCTRCPHSEQR